MAAAGEMAADAAALSPLRWWSCWCLSPWGAEGIPTVQGCLAVNGRPTTIKRSFSAALMPGRCRSMVTIYKDVSCFSNVINMKGKTHGKM